MVNLEIRLKRPTECPTGSFCQFDNEMVTVSNAYPTRSVCFQGGETHMSVSCSRLQL